MAGTISFTKWAAGEYAAQYDGFAVAHVVKTGSGKWAVEGDDVAYTTREQAIRERCADKLRAIEERLSEAAYVAESAASDESRDKLVAMSANVDAEYPAIVDSDDADPWEWETSAPVVNAERLATLDAICDELAVDSEQSVKRAATPALKRASARQAQRSERELKPVREKTITRYQVVRECDGTREIVSTHARRHGARYGACAVERSLRSEGYSVAGRAGRGHLATHATRMPQYVVIDKLTKDATGLVTRFQGAYIASNGEKVTDWAFAYDQTIVNDSAGWVADELVLDDAQSGARKRVAKTTERDDASNPTRRDLLITCADSVAYCKTSGDDATESKQRAMSVAQLVAREAALNHEGRNALSVRNILTNAVRAGNVARLRELDIPELDVELTTEQIASMSA
jgi:hypothetical protein